MLKFTIVRIFFIKQLDVTVPGMKELPDQQHPGNWIEHSVELSLRNVDLLQLTQFMEEVKSNSKKFQIAIPKLDVRKYGRSEGQLIVKMIISTYERLQGEDAPSKRPAGAGRRGGR